MNRLLFIAATLWAALAPFPADGQERDPQTIVLHAGWQFSESRQNKWQPAVVPGTVHLDLIRLGQLPDPFYGTNEDSVQWVEDKDWEYKTTFTLSAEQLQYTGAVLRFEGLDTYADVYLNGALIVKADNMFVGYEVPVKEILREGENRLHIYFYSAVNKALPQYESNGFDYPADNDHHIPHTSVFTRKAPYHYGWDWGIRLVGCGVWRPVELRLFHTAEVSDYHIRQVDVSKEHALLSNELEMVSVDPAPVPVEVMITGMLNGLEIQRIQTNTVLLPGINTVQMDMHIAQPELWMPAGWGAQPLYDFTATIRRTDGSVIAQTHRRTGLRSIRAVNIEDSVGKSFYLEVNGHPLFAKGANYIPTDIILPRTSREKYRQLFDHITAANMNMIRVWGGGIYEEDYFYELADEYGILVWQDFMFSCVTYPSDPAFLQSVEQEATYNIKRLRNHPSIALWCGNNEVAEALKYWGWRKRIGEKYYNDMFAGYDKLFRDLLPRKVRELDSARFYIHSSPDTANWGNNVNTHWGDSHYWGVWYNDEPFEIFDINVSRFVSEYGFQAFPEMKVIETFAAPADYTLESAAIMQHQKCKPGNEFIKTYMERYYHVPEKFDDFVYVGLVLQGRGMRHGMEAHRRNKPYCMGTLYWQLNDDWPSTSWSGIDYYGNWKALHYQAQRAFAPVLINAMEEAGRLNYYLISDLLHDCSDLTLESQLIDFNGQVLKRESRRVNLPANRSVKVWEQAVDTVVTPEQRTHTFVLLTLNDNNGQRLNRQVYYFEHPKHLQLPVTTIDHKIKYRNGSCEVTLSTKQLAKDVFIEIPVQGARFSDNFFDLLPGETRTVTITAHQLSKTAARRITIRHLRETY